ncbi:uracil-DNA glycosylase family protein [Limibacterium fermenti]|jgi:G:T/U-mismatch repair DNA glycosylase|uniref:uracil-DNA glycosylase family protein n=1 Tax=Limibacterium fermenti TaxID=3229863 RepID=UPI0026A8BAD9
MMKELEIETHPLKPFVPENATLLLLGSFPPPRQKWKMDFYYPNFQNDMWRIFGLIFFNDKDSFLNEEKTSFDKERIVSFLTEKGIAVTDTARQVIRKKQNASDNFLEVVKPFDLEKIVAEIPLCRTLVTTGAKATETLQWLLPELYKGPAVGRSIEITYHGRPFHFYRMPSSSRAYPKPLIEKATVYARLFEEAGIL